jgi:hypothetical protein
MSSTSDESPALQEARAILQQAGVTGCHLEAAGPEGEVLLLQLTEAEENRLFGPEGSQLRARLRAVGFRYVATDLAPEPE